MALGGSHFGFKKIGYRLAILFFVLIISPIVRADTLGQDQLFSISPQYDSQSRPSVSATLRKVSDHAYFYVEDNYWNSAGSDLQNQMLSQINALADEFDNRIYPIERQFFGPERNPGINGGTRITILLSPLIKNAGGYYDTANEYPKQKAAASNEREMAYLNIDQLTDQRKIFTFLAHEFQHLITFNQKDVIRGISDDTWLNELRSEYAVTLLGYNDTFIGSNLERRLQSFLDNPSGSLTEWKNLPSDYGQIALFGEYLVEHWSPKILSDSLQSDLIGIPSLEYALTKDGFKDSFADVFADWLIADILNDTSANPKFGYMRDGLKNFHVTPSKVLNNLSDDLTFAVSDSIKDWQLRWYDVSQFAQGQNNFLKIDFSSPSITSFYVPYVIFKPDGSRVISTFNPTFSSSVLYPGDITKDLNRIIFMPIKKDKLSGFSSNETPVTLTFSLDRIRSLPVGMPAMTPTPVPSPQGIPSQPVQSIPDGSLVRVRGDYRVYVINGRWRRHILNPKIFSFYPQWGFNKVQEVDLSVLAQYENSDLIRYGSGKRVYAVDETGMKHWLDMSAGQFTSSGRFWDSIFLVNLSELNFYKTGTNITK